MTDTIDWQMCPDCGYMVRDINNHSPCPRNADIRHRSECYTISLILVGLMVGLAIVIFVL